MRSIGRPWLRLLLVLAWIAAAMAVPVTVVKACSCGFLGYPDAIRQADLAFVGTVAAGEALADDGFVDDVMPEAAYAFDVERAKEPMDDRVIIAAATGGGGSCGLALAEGQRWLIIANVEQGKPRTNLCTGSTEYDGLPAESRREVDAMLAASAPAPASVPDGPSLPAPVLVVGGVAALIGLVGLIAFRQRPT